MANTYNPHPCTPDPCSIQSRHWHSYGETILCGLHRRNIQHRHAWPGMIYHWLRPEAWPRQLSTTTQLPPLCNGVGWRRVHPASSQQMHHMCGAGAAASLCMATADMTHKRRRGKRPPQSNKTKKRWVLPSVWSDSRHPRPHPLTPPIKPNLEYTCVRSSHILQRCPFHHTTPPCPPVCRYRPTPMDQ